MIRFVAVAGSIGAGKSSLIDFLKGHYGLKPFYEGNDENPFLEDFYGDMARFAFPTQVWFLTRKFQAHQEIRRHRGPAILDRTIYEDAEVFARHLFKAGFLSPREWESYSTLYRAVSATLPPPDLVIYLKSSVRTQKKRIRLRGRAMEQSLATAYLQGINDLYRRWLKSWDLSPVLIIDADRIDFVADLVHRADVLGRLNRLLGDRRRKKGSS